MAVPGIRSAAPAGARSAAQADTARRSVGDARAPTLAVGLVALASAAAGVAATAIVVLVVTIVLPPGEAPAPVPALPFAEAFAPTDGFGLEAPAVAVPDVLVVDVSGAVTTPGLHRLRPGDRVGDAIEAAGGFAPRADLGEAARSLNLAAPLADGTKVLVPELGTERPAVGARDGRIDLNRADRSELEDLPGVGPVTAQRIIDARDDARFSAPDELRTRGLVGESVFARLKDLVRAGA